MLRVMILLLTAVVMATNASAGDVWSKIKTFEIDQRHEGSAFVDLSEAGGIFTALRFQSAVPITVAYVKTTGKLIVKTNSGSFKAGPGLPSDPFFSTETADGLKSLQLKWEVFPGASGPVLLEVWGLVPQFDDGGGGVDGSGRADDRDESVAKSAGDHNTSGRDSSARNPTEVSPRGRQFSRSRAAPSAAPPPPAPSSQGVGGDASPNANACIDQSTCTIVPVFFGTDRNQIAGADRISFGSERTNTLTLGQTIVTVPKVKRDRGTIKRPWLERYLGMTVAGDPKLHFTIPKSGVTVYDTESDFLLNVKRHIAQAGTYKDHAFIYVHGFAVTFDYAMYRAAQIAYDLTGDEQPFGTAFVYSWPSKGSVLPTAYLADSDAALDSAENFRAFVKLVTEKTGAANVHIIAHSMGNRVLLRTLQNIKLSGGTTTINQVILAAPDVDRQEFENVAKGVGRLAKGITLYASKTDAALVISRRMRGGISRAGDVFNPPGPAIVDGIDTVDISALSTAIFDYGHDTYANSSELLADIATLFTKANAHPPTSRNVKFKLLQQGALQYWSYAR